MRFQLQCLIVLGAFVTTTSYSQAQPRAWVGGGVGVGVGPSWNYYNLPGGPYTYPYFGPGFGWGWYPGAYGSFWTNGMSLYGPPVPTMGTVPGSFGGSDAHKHFYSTPPRQYGLGWFGYRSPSPRHLPLSVDVNPPATYTGPGYDTVAPREAVPASESNYPSVGAASLKLCVKVPVSDAKVWIDGHPTQASGLERWFESPAVASGQEYLYQVTAKWADGQIDTKTVSGKAGETLQVQFGTPTTAVKR